MPVTLHGVIPDFPLAPANVKGLEAGAALLAGHRDPRVLGGKGSLSPPVATDPLATTGSGPLTVPRKSRRRRLATQFHIEQNRAHTARAAAPASPASALPTPSASTLTASSAPQIPSTSRPSPSPTSTSAYSLLDSAAAARLAFRQ